jgi:hypothetical protein
VQGYLLERPMSAEQFEEFLENNGSGAPAMPGNLPPPLPA